MEKLQVELAKAGVIKDKFDFLTLIPVGISPLDRVTLSRSRASPCAMRRIAYHRDAP